MARSMLSFGMEFSRAFSIAFASARLAAGSGPPSRAATMIARTSFENSCPRFASAAPFCRRIECHLLCPDTRLLPHHLDEALVHSCVLGQLRVERGDEHPPLAEEHRFTIVLGEHLDLGSCLTHARGANEHSAQRDDFVLELEVGLEARHLASVGIPLDG